MCKVMTEENDLEKIEEWVNKGISLQRESKHQRCHCLL